MANQGLPGYDQPIGSKKLWIGDVTGPANYQAGGYNFNASALGWGGFDHVSGGQSWNTNNSGNFFVNVYYPVKSQNGAVSRVTLKWFAANGTEAANASNLTTEFSRIKAIGV